MTPWEPRPSLVDLARLALGAGALARPSAVLGVVGSREAAAPRRITQLLGARYVVQAAAGLVLRRHRALPAVDATVDLLHALSMLAAARAFPEHRRPALTSAAVALAFGVADLTTAST